MADRFDHGQPQPHDQHPDPHAHPHQPQLPGQPERTDGGAEESVGTDGYRAGSDGYRGGSTGYPRAAGDAPARGEPREAEPREDSSEDEAGAKPWWVRAGFSSLEEFIGDLDRTNEKILGPLGLWERPAAELADPDLSPLDGDGSPPDPPPAHASRVKSRQVGVKLRPADFADLVTAAGTYGVAPSTLARMLIVRGLRSVSGLDRSRTRAGS